jgi:hypothetical protein
MFARLAGTLLAVLLMVPLWLGAQDTPANPPTRRETIRVLLPDGVTPAAAATYFVHTLDERWEKQGTTNAAGRATIEYPTEAPAQFHVIALEGTARIDLREGQAGDRSVTLAPYRTVEGHVYTEDRKPVAGAWVWYDRVPMEQMVGSGNRHESQEVMTDDEGHYRFDRVEAGPGEISMASRGSGKVPSDWMEEYIIPRSPDAVPRQDSTQSEYVFVLKKGVSLKGTVREESDSPVNGARVEAQSNGNYLPGVLSDERGRFTFGGLPREGVYAVHAWGPLHEASTPVSVDLARTNTVALKLTRKISVQLELTGTDGSPVRRFSSQRLGNFYPLGIPPHMPECITESNDGRLPLLHGRREQIAVLLRQDPERADGPTGVAAQQIDFSKVKEGEIIPVRLRPVYPITGRVVSRLDGKPIEGVWILLGRVPLTSLKPQSSMIRCPL